MEVTMEPEQPRKVMVSERALMARIRRKLAKEDRQIVAARPTASDPYLAYYIIDGDLVTERIWQHGRALYDIEDLARQVGVLKAWEEVEWNE
jgi:hypothetical protein